MNLWIWKIVAYSLSNAILDNLETLIACLICTRALVPKKGTSKYLFTEFNYKSYHFPEESKKKCDQQRMPPMTKWGTNLHIALDVFKKKHGKAAGGIWRWVSVTPRD